MIFLQSNSPVLGSLPEDLSKRGTRDWMHRLILQERITDGNGSSDSDARKRRASSPTVRSTSSYLSRAAASVRRWTCSLSRILCTWFLTVGTAMLSRWAISLFERPWSSSSATSISRAVSDELGEGPRSSAASAPTRLSRLAAILGEHSISPRATLSTKSPGRRPSVSRDVTGSPCLRTGDHIGLRVGHREGDDLCFRRRLAKGADGVEALVHRHVDEHDVGLEIPDPGERLL